MFVRHSIFYRFFWRLECALSKICRPSHALRSLDKCENLVFHCIKIRVKSLPKLHLLARPALFWQLLEVIVQLQTDSLEHLAVDLWEPVIKLPVTVQLVRNSSDRPTSAGTVRAIHPIATAIQLIQAHQSVRGQ